ncbi:MAG TPA: zinc-binding alcohol dehydrogenase family protein [Minicystis sp.]|nr:zinc-binding alcohol dehydrogenase family protein [Minicystis sp.]
MRIAFEMDDYGGPDVLVARERRDWEPGPGEVVVRSVASGVNRADAFIRSGAWKQAGPFPYVPGLEVAGLVARAGAGTTLREGDAVVTMMQRLGGIHGERAGGYQSHVLVREAVLARVPPGLDAKAAAALGLPAVTALLALDALDVRPGQRVLVHAGSSAVGSMALELVRALGAEPLGSGTSPAKFEFMRAHGAVDCVDTRSPEWAARVRRVDRALDLVGSATFGATVRALADGGRLVFAGGTSGGELAFSGWDLMRGVTLAGYSSESLTQGELGRALERLAALVVGSRVAVPAAQEFALADAAAAHRALESSAHAGRILLVPSPRPEGR